MKFRLSPEQSLMCQCMRHYKLLDAESIRSAYAAINDNRLYDECKRNKVQMIVGHALSVVIGREGIPNHWFEAYDSTANLIQRYMAELDRAAALLQREGIAMLALKNSGITRGLYDAWGSCPMGDLDVLVDPERFQDAHTTLLEAGYKLKFRSHYEENSYEAALASGGAEYSVKLDGGDHLWFELQWRPIAGRWIQESQEPKAADLVARSKPILGTNVRLLCPEDNLIQVCLHTAKHSFVRSPGFRLHTDVDRIVSTEELNWDVFVDRVENLQVRTPTYLSLLLAVKLLGTPVPSWVLSQLAPSQLKVRLVLVWLEHVGIFYPDDKKWGRLSFVLFVSLLFDTPRQLIEGLFPSLAQLQKRYGYQSVLLTPYYFSRYIVDLLLKRTNT